MRPCRLARADDRHPRALGRMAADGRVHGAGRFDMAACHRVIVPPHAARLQLPDEIGLRFERPGDDHQAAGILVEPMDDAGPRQPGEFRRTMQQRIEQGTAPVAAPRMHHQARRLVDHQQALVLVHHLQGNILGRRRFGALVGRLGEFDRFAGPEPLPRLQHRRAADGHPAGADPPLQAAARMLRQQPGKNLVQSLSTTLGRYVQGRSGVCAIIARPGALLRRSGSGLHLLWVLHHA
jgi:hypothetical protein